MAYIDEFGVKHFYDNSFSALLGRLVSSWQGVTLVVLPLLLFIGGFFLIKNYLNNKKYLILGYVITSILLYAIYFYLLIERMKME